MGERVLSEAELAEIEQIDAEDQKYVSATLSLSGHHLYDAVRHRAMLIKHIRATEAQAALSRAQAGGGDFATELSVDSILKRIRQNVAEEEKAMAGTERRQSRSQIDRDVLLRVVEHLQAALQPPRDGWQWVPKEPTEEMCRAATIIAPTWDDAVSAAKYRAMLQAAPKEGETK